MAIPLISNIFQTIKENGMIIFVIAFSSTVFVLWWGLNSDWYILWILFLQREFGGLYFYNYITIASLNDFGT